MTRTSFPSDNRERFDKVHDKSSTLPVYSLVRHGVVYAVVIRGRVKIGITRLPRKRLMQMEAAFGERFEKIYVSHPIENYKEVEKLCHAEIRDFKLLGEWFGIDFLEAIHLIKDFVEPETGEIEVEDYDSRKYYEYKAKKKPWIKVKGLHTYKQ